MSTKSSLFFLFLFFYSLFIQAQNGDLFVQNYEVPFDDLDNQNLAVIQGGDQIMYFANTKGVLAYDGVSWTVINTVTTPYSLAYEKERNRVYVGCNDDFGYLFRNSTGREVFVSMSGRAGKIVKMFGFEINVGKKEEKREDLGAFTRIEFTSDFIYFYSDRTLVQVSRKTLEVLQKWKAKEQPFAGFFLFKKDIYINVQGVGLHKVSASKQLELLDPDGDYNHTGKRFLNLYLNTFLTYDDENVLFGADNSWSYLFDGERFKLYFYEAEDYLKANQLNFHQSLGIDSLSGKELIASATLTGGLMIVTKEVIGKDYKIINFQTGLPDDEVYALTQDHLGGIWICHGKGISRISLNLPIVVFSEYAGLDGSVNTALKLGGQKEDSIYVGTSRGVYFLQKVEKFEEVQAYIKKEARFMKEIETITKIIRITEPKERVNFRRYQRSSGADQFNRDYSRRIRTKETSEVTEAPSQILKTEEVRRSYSTDEKRKAYALRSIPYVFKHAKGLDGKVRQMIAHQGFVMVASNLGLFEVVHGEELAVREIIPDVYVHFMWQNLKNPAIAYVGTSEGLFVMTQNGGGWEEAYPVQNISENIYSMVQWRGELWAGAENRILRIPLDTTGLPKNPPIYSKEPTFTAYPIQDSYSENVVVRDLDNKLKVIMSSVLYEFDTKDNKLIKLPAKDNIFTNRSKIFYSQPKYTWVDKNGRWRNLQKSENEEDSIQSLYLEVFNDVQGIYVDDLENKWVVNGTELYRVNRKNSDTKGLENYKQYFDVYVRNITTRSGEFIPITDSLVVDYGDTTINLDFQLASPFYQKEDETVYQYWLEGIEGNKKDGKPKWSDWNKQARVSFPFLPAGEYRLHIRARNVFGQDIQKRIFYLKVEPPFWETYTFYALQTLFFLGLLIASFFLSRRGKYSTLSYVLTFVTIITLFEFLILLLEPYVDDFTGGIPVFKLGMNILLAISLAPIEQLLRRALIRRRENDSNVKYGTVKD